MQCSVFIATSLDGFIARPDGRLDWLSLVERPGEDYGYQQLHDSIDVLIIGRKTYETALGFPSWPYAGKRCIVLFGATGPDLPLTLVASRSFPSGLVQLAYTARPT